MLRSARNRTIALFALLLVSNAIACRKPSPPRVDPSDKVALAPEAPSLRPSAVDASSPDAAPPASAPTPSAEALAARARAIAMGRSATQKGDTKAAVDAFTRALDVLAADPQILGERGFAKLRGGDNAGARTDFLSAIALGGPPKLVAQLYFNVGLLDEKQGDAAAARTAYARSKRLHATPAVLAKLAGAMDTCPLSFPELPAITEYASWSDALRALRSGSSTPPPNAREPRCPPDSSTCRSLKDGRVLVVSASGSLDLDVLVEDEHGHIHAVRNAVQRWDGGFKCPETFPEVQADVTGGVLRLDSSVVMCSTGCPTDKLVDCSSSDNGTRTTTAFWDVRAHRPVAAIAWEDPEGSPGKFPSVDEAGILRFEGCNLRQRIPYDSAK
ncbi:hypothetical protein AKJ09_03202 [Labilithrix luteola]|uniref:Tetratricopeptide repeat protein n=1 Tax=Labilithrix luteola TaxID=1391654 RepID=A0A0K1PSM5_9BACT|nr:hypothetical protein [Labilithrix luteola]AKU96538.1 hypothetical protein AKJ09_03202 [Labilithrix luteola]